MRTLLLLVPVVLLAIACGKQGSDKDKDGFGEKVDCAPEDASIFPGKAETCNGKDDNCDGNVDEGVSFPYFTDGDDDGYGADSTLTFACEPPEGMVPNGGDCDDGSADFHPNADESDCTSTVDYNCDGSVLFEDGDEDGVYACQDCNDADAEMYPGNIEVCDDKDNDCNFQVDDNAEDAETWYFDADEDTYGGNTVSQVACDQPAGYVDNNDDCFDLDETAYPGGTELCDGVDNDCDDEIDDGFSVGEYFYLDDDNDTFGDAGAEVQACEKPFGYVRDDNDCDDADSDINPDANELCDDVDNDCDGDIDEEDATDANEWYWDADEDGYGGPLSLNACEKPSGFVANDDDCDDTSAGNNPDGQEVCDDIDNDCDGDVDDNDATLDIGTGTAWYDDSDGDTYGDPSDLVVACDNPGGRVVNDDDCNDASSSVKTASTWYRDFDSDTLGDMWTRTESCTKPSGYVSDDSDCDDTDATIASGSWWYEDTDEDGFGDASAARFSCASPLGHVTDDTDCDDTDDVVYPGAPERCDSADTDCSGGGSERAVPGSYSTISSALSAASNGDAICIGAGTYDMGSSNLYIGKNVTLEGTAGSGSTTITNTGTSYVIYANNSKVAFIGLEVTGGHYNYGGGMYLYQGAFFMEDFVLTGNTCDCSGDCTYCYGTGMYVGNADLTMRDSEISGNDGTVPNSSASNTYESGYGIGMYWYAPGKTLDMQDVLVVDNSFTSTSNATGNTNANGIGMHLGNYATINLDNVVVADNICDMDATTTTYGYCYGVGIDFGQQHTITGNNLWVTGNTASIDASSSTYTYGVGMRAYDSKVNLTNFVVGGNETTLDGNAGYAEAYGTGMWFAYSSGDLTLTNGSVINNYSGLTSTGSDYAYGVGLYYQGSGSKVTMTNVDFTGNTGSADSVNGGAMYVYAGSTSLTYNNFYNNGSTPFSGISSPVGSNGNISQDPKYVDTSTTPTYLWDLSLGSTSGLINAGDPALYDVDGTRSDIGAYGGEGSIW